MHFNMRRGLGPDTVPKVVFVGLDDLDPEVNNEEIRSYAISDAEEQLRRSDDYELYGRTWQFQEILET